MAEPKWYRAWKGDRKCLPLSERQGHELTKTVLSPLQAQIAVFFGIAEGDIEALRSGVTKLAEGKPLICESCARSIWDGGHQRDCGIVKQFMEVATGAKQE